MRRIEKKKGCEHPEKLKGKTGECNQNTEYFRYENSAVIMLRKKDAVRIGTFSKLGNYKIVMRFTDNLGNESEYMRMAQFDILFKNRRT
jgi:hypothetical protein